MSRFTRMLGFVFALALALGGSAGAVQPPNGGIEEFVDFSNIVPDLNVLFGQTLHMMDVIGLPATVDAIARFVVAGTAIIAAVLALNSYATGKDVRFLGIEGSFNTLFLSVLAVIAIGVGIPRVVGEASWALWRLTYNSVEQTVYPLVEQGMRDETGRLAEAVYAYAVSGGGIATQPYISATAMLRPDSGLDPAQAYPAAMVENHIANAQSGEQSNKSFGTLWTIGTLLIIGMFLGYIGVIYTSGLFVLFLGMFMPVVFAFMPTLGNLLPSVLGRIVTSILVAATAPVLMLLNVMLVMRVPIAYLSTMMENNVQAANNNAQVHAGLMQSCVNMVTSRLPDLAALENVASRIVTPVCTLGVTDLARTVAVGQGFVYTILGLIIAVVIFIGLSGIAAMTFRTFKEVVDLVLGQGGGAYHPSSGRGRAFAGGVVNRAAGAGVGALGLATGNAAMARAGANAVISGRNALGAAVAGRIGSGIERQQEDRAERRRLGLQAESKAERQQEWQEREAYRERQRQQSEESKAHAQNARQSGNDPAQKHADDQQGAQEGDGVRDNPGKAPREGGEHTPPRNRNRPG